MATKPGSTRPTCTPCAALLEVQRVGPAHERELARRVAARPRARDPAGGAGDVDDRAGRRAAQERQQRLGETQLGVEVQLHVPADVLAAALARRSPATRTPALLTSRSRRAVLGLDALGDPRGRVRRRPGRRRSTVARAAARPPAPAGGPRAGRRAPRCAPGSRARRRAVASPMPLEAPVTSAIIRAEQRRDEVGALARHPRAGHHAGRTRASGRATASRRRRGGRSRACARRAARRRRRASRPAPMPSTSSADRSTTSTSAGSADHTSSSRPHSDDLVAGRASAACDAGAEEQVGHQRGDRGYCARSGGTPGAPTRAAPTSGRPRRARCAPRAPRARPSMPASSSSFSAPCTAGAAAAWPKRWATSIRQCQSCCEYGCALQVTR